MWGIFLESVVIFKNYVGFHQYKFLFVIYLFFLFYLLLAEKNRRIRAILVYAPLLLLICFFVPLFRKVFVRLLNDAETYYRLLWLLQMSLVSAYGAVKLSGRYRKTGLVVMCAAIVLCGSFVYRSEYITKAQNWYHLPEEAVEVAKLLEPEEGRVMALVPADLIYYIRQYSTNINMPYGREMLIARWDYYNDIRLPLCRSEKRKRTAGTDYGAWIRTLCADRHLSDLSGYPIGNRMTGGARIKNAI